MYRAVLRSLMWLGVLSVALWTIGAAEAEAGWHSCGSSGGSYGSYGSWGSHGSWGSYGSWGGYGLLHRWHAHRAYRYAYASHGSWGSYGSYGSHGSWGSYGSHGSVGGTYIQPEVQPSVPSTPPVPADAPPELPPQSGDAQARATSALLIVSVPADAKIFVNGKATTSEGSVRQYVSRGLRPGSSYTYEVRAERVVDGKTVEETRSVEMHAGDTTELAFRFEPGKSPETTLTLNVPSESKVFLAGNETSATGNVRTFRTSKLASGDAWENYKIRVTLEREGQVLTQERTITLAAGDSQVITIDFDAAKVADAR